MFSASTAVSSTIRSWPHEVRVRATETETEWVFAVAKRGYSGELSRNEQQAARCGHLGSESKLLSARWRRQLHSPGARGSCDDELGSDVVHVLPARSLGRGALKPLCVVLAAASVRPMSTRFVKERLLHQAQQIIQAKASRHLLRNGWECFDMFSPNA